MIITFFYYDKNKKSVSHASFRPIFLKIIYFSIKTLKVTQYGGG